MDWKSLGPLVATAAPPLARLLLGEIPVVGPIIAEVGGDAVGALIAKQFGVEATPEAVHAAITAASPEDVTAKLQAAAAEAVAKWPALAEIAKADAAAASAETAATSATISAELINGTAWQRNWRPLIGYVAATLILVWGLEIAIAMAIAIATSQLQVMNAVFAGITSLVFFLSVPGSIAGAVSIGRSFEKVKGLQVGGYGGFVAGAATVAGAAAKVLPGPAAKIIATITRVIPGRDRQAG